ncbi:MAG: sigma-70 family RNA polymerase sigma factor [Bryobacterales bacterium]|nr:sigma-70 family RNA polymerase sigma factor [Bryobacterales bacterium]
MPFDRDTEIGGPSARFPHTRHSAIASARSDQPAERERAYSSIVSGYWKPAYKYIRIQWNRSNEDAKDLTQAFFAAAFEKNYFQAYDSSKGSFRNFLRTCLDAFVSKQDQAAARLKRGGGAAVIPLDFESAEGELQALPIPSGMSTEEFFYKEWVRHLFSAAVESLREECEAAGRQQHFILLERYDLDQTAASYDELARELNIPVTTVTNHLAWARRRFRRLVLDAIREVTGSDDEFQKEARQLLGGGAV